MSHDTKQTQEPSGKVALAQMAECLSDNPPYAAFGPAIRSIAAYVSELEARSDAAEALRKEFLAVAIDVRDMLDIQMSIGFPGVLFQSHDGAEYITGPNRFIDADELFDRCVKLSTTTGEQP